MSNKNVLIILVLSLLLIASRPCILYANNISVTSGSLADQDTSNGTVDIQFSLSCDNSWRDSVNYDAAWIFIKYSIDSGVTWNHATLNTSGTNPSGFSIGTGTEVEIIVTTDKRGCFIQRSESDSGTLTTNDIILVWDYSGDGVSNENANSPNTRVRVFAIEMVYIPQGSFLAGDTDADRTGNFKGGKTQNVPISVTSEDALVFNAENTGPYYYTTGGNPNEWINGATFTVSSGFPKGYNAFYLMKYEISQGLWKDFFNTLTDAQKTTRDITSSTNNGKNADIVVKRNAISWTSGDASLVNGREGDRAMNYISWMDLAAFADWAALRPMSELEYEKACRGTGSSIDDEYAWGNTTITAAGTISGTENGAETISTPTANCCYNDTNFSGGDGGKGPLRCGIFATLASSRQSSGAGYYGAMELSGNVWERCATVGNSTGLNYIGTHGDGFLTTSGNATNTDWPGIDAAPSNGVTGATGSGFRGGGWYETTSATLAVGDRTWAARTDSNRSDSGNNYWGYGGRCARTAP